MCKHKDILKAPISKTATMLPTSIALGDSKKLTKQGPVMIPDITLHVLSWVSVGTIGSKGYMPLIISELQKKPVKKKYESYFIEKTNEKYAQTREHGDCIQQLVSNQFPARFNGHLNGFWARMYNIRFRAFNRIEKGSRSRDDLVTKEKGKSWLAR